MIIKIINLSVTPKCFLIALIKTSLHVLHSPSKQSVMYFVLLQISLHFLEIHINGIISHMLFLVKFLSLCLIVLRSILLCVSVACCFLLLSRIPMYIYVTMFIYSLLVDIWVFTFYCYRHHVILSLCMDVLSISWIHYLGLEWLGHMQVYVDYLDLNLCFIKYQLMALCQYVRYKFVRRLKLYDSCKAGVGKLFSSKSYFDVYKIIDSQYKIIDLKNQPVIFRQTFT